MRQTDELEHLLESLQGPSFITIFLNLILLASVSTEVFLSIYVSTHLNCKLLRPSRRKTSLIVIAPCILSVSKTLQPCLSSGYLPVLRRDNLVRTLLTSYLQDWDSVMKLEGQIEITETGSMAWYICSAEQAFAEYSLPCPSCCLVVSSSDLALRVGASSKTRLKLSFKAAMTQLQMQPWVILWVCHHRT